MLNEDVQTLVAWHQDRPEHEQRRLLKTLGSLYTSYKDFGTKAQQQPQKGEQIIMAQGDEDALDRLQKSESAPDLALSVKQLKPIDVFEKKRREDASGRRRRGPLSENTLQRWLEQESNASTAAGTETTLASSWTGVSSLSKTSIGSSVNSAPCTTTKMAYQHHKRALAVNRRKWATRKAHEPGVLEDGLPTDNYPDERRLITSMARDFGTRPLGIGINSKMWQHLFSEDKHSFVEEHLEKAEPAERESFKGMIRALQNLKRIRHFSTSYERQYDAAENERLWKPPKEKPATSTEKLQQSQVPLGTIDSLVDFCHQRQELPKTRQLIPMSKADILVVDHDGAASSIAESDALSLTSDPLMDLRVADAMTPSSAGGGGGYSARRAPTPGARPVPPPVPTLPPLVEATQESQE